MVKGWTVRLGANNGFLHFHKLRGVDKIMHYAWSGANDRGFLSSEIATIFKDPLIPMRYYIVIWARASLTKFDKTSRRKGWGRILEVEPRFGLSVSMAISCYSNDNTSLLQRKYARRRRYANDPPAKLKVPGGIAWFLWLWFDWRSCPSTSLLRR